jgi:nicotinate-nucleotide adenylyltransferase
MFRTDLARFGSAAASLPAAARGQRIGLLGGSFNPPHAAHRQISQIALSRLGLDRVWWIVTPGNPLKEHGELKPQAERIAAARAVAQDNRIVITGFEADLPSRFTAATLTVLRRRRPDVRFVWIMGADCLADFHRWQHWRDIFALMPIAVIDRPSWHLKALSSRAARTFAADRWPARCARGLIEATPPAWTLITGPLSTLSSTELRRAGSQD